MKHASATEFRANLSKLMDQVNDDHEPLMVTRAGGKPVVMVALEDYSAMDETTYLTSSEANRQALCEAIHETDDDRHVTKTMAELEAMEDE